MDHVGDESYLQPLLEAAQNDATPKNRRHATHALTCEICKPNRSSLDIDIRSKLAEIAKTDSDSSVRIMALHELSVLTDPQEKR